jgi:hypothetical protein
MREELASRMHRTMHEGQEYFFPAHNNERRCKLPAQEKKNSRQAGEYSGGLVLK